MKAPKENRAVNPSARCFGAGFVLLLLTAAVLVPLIQPRLAQSQTTDAASERAKGSAVRRSGAAVTPLRKSARADVQRTNLGSRSRLPTDKALVTGMRSTVSNGYTRITIELSQQAKYEIGRLKREVARGVPLRVYVTIFGAQLALNSKQPVLFNDKLLRQIRIEQYSPDAVRLVFDMQSGTAHNAFMLANPYRLVIDIAGKKDPEPPQANAVRAKIQSINHARPAQPANTGSGSIAAKRLHKIVLDPGHGGKDPGASGFGGLTEKDIVLSIAKKLAVKLKLEMGAEVVLTRTDDRFVSLEDRTAMANAEDADLFISLHVNASPNSEAKGIETYYLDNTTDEAAIRLAARENATSRKNISDLQFILSDMTQSMKLEDSVNLAHRLQSSLVDGMSQFIGDVRDLGVKKALFHVLVGARMPSVLVEMFFITNRSESRAMAQPNFQDEMVNALYEGIQKYTQSNLVAKTL